MDKYSLVGIDGNAFAVMGYTANSMKEVGFSAKEIEDYYGDAMSSNYDYLLAISAEMIEKCNERASGE